MGLAAPAPLPAPATVDELVADYLAGEDFGRLTRATRARYGLWLAHFAAVFGHMAPGEVTTPMVEHWTAAAPGRAAAAGWLGVVGALWRHGRRRGLAGESPGRGARRPSLPPRDRYVTDDELALFAAGAGPRLRAYLGLKLATGLRRGQIRLLRWANWDAARGELSVAAAKAGYATRYTGRGVVDAVAAVRAVFGAGAPADPMVPRRRGGFYAESKHLLRADWDRARAAYLAAGGAPFREHDLRAKVATDTDDLLRAQMLLGHTTPRMTENVYRRMGRRVASAEPAVRMRIDGGDGGESLQDGNTRESNNRPLPDGLCQLDLFDAAGSPGDAPGGDAGAPAPAVARGAGRREALAARYRAGATVTELARGEGVAKSTVVWHLRRAGVELRGAGRSAAPLPALARRYAAGETLRALALDAGVSAATLRGRLAAFGVEIRKRGAYERRSG